MTLTIERAQQLLSQVSHDHIFWLSNGKPIKSLEELGTILPHISDDEWSHHVNDHRNDFCAWIRGVFQHEELAKNLESIMKKKQAGQLVRLEVGRIKRMVSRATAPKIVEKKQIEKKSAHPGGSTPAPKHSKPVQPKTVPKPKPAPKKHHKKHERKPKLENDMPDLTQVHGREQIDSAVEALRKPMPPPPPPFKPESASEPVQEPSEEHKAISNFHSKLHPHVRRRLGAEPKNHDEAMKELLSQHSELEQKEGKLLEIEKRIEQRYHSLRASHHSFFNKEFLYGSLIGGLVVLIIVALVLKLAFPDCLPW